jgi:hypothetical protein
MRTTQRAGAVLVVFTLAVTLLSCSKNPAGIYVSSRNPQVTLELKGDGTFIGMLKGNATPMATGTYKIEGTVITLTEKGEGKSESGKIEGDVITDPNGGTWTRQK